MKILVATIRGQKNGNPLPKKKFREMPSGRSASLHAGMIAQTEGQ
jgi:hypothetical protein